jgi:hypothetical protein
MLRLVNDVRPIQDRCRQLELEDRDFDLHRLLRTWNMRLQIQQKHGDKVKLDFEVSKDVPQNVYWRQHACAADCLQSDIERVQVYKDSSSCIGL